MTQFSPSSLSCTIFAQNNNHEWFEAHRPEYDQAKALFQDFIQGLIPNPAIRPLGDLAAKDAIFRIHNDIGFARNQAALKEPLLRRARSRRQALSRASPIIPADCTPGQAHCLYFKRIFISWGQGVEKTASFRVRMNRTPCITTKNYKSNKGI